MILIFHPKKIIMRTNITYTLLAAALLTSVIFTSCTKTTAVAAAVLAVDSTKTTTAHDATIAFSNYKTIALADSVTVINGTVTKELTSTDSAYLVSLKNAFTTKGFSVVSKTANPDLVLNISRIGSTADGLIDSASYWSNYSSYYSPAIFGESGLLYTANLNTSVSVQDGALSFELIDLKNAATNNLIAIVWDGIISGYTLLSNINSVSIETGILFSKSPYLKTN
jgi:hypothetical protein